MSSDKARIKKTINSIRRVKTWQLFIVLILMVFVAATFWRLNNVGMEQRRDAVKAADKSGNLDEVQSRLYDLQRYVVAHMNADTGEMPGMNTVKNNAGYQVELTLEYRR